MRSVRRRSAVAFVAVVFALAACADQGVSTLGAVTSPTAPPTTVPPTTTSPLDEPATTTTLPATPTVEFEPCEESGLDAPSLESWECGVLTAPMDPGDPSGPTVDIAVTRRPGSRSGGRALLVSPGGPGAGGVEYVWQFAEFLPIDLLRLYDVVSWDPRGVGRSEPSVTCPRGARWSDTDLLARCAESTGQLMAHMSTPNHVADLEALRVALEQERLDYVGYSYGTYLGAAYANAHPEGVGRFVLDGPVSPVSGTLDAPVVLGEPWYADDGYGTARSRFFELCDATTLCDLGDSGDAFDALVVAVQDLPTDTYPGQRSIDALQLEAIVDAAMFDPFNWGLLATGLEDARAGDASTLDALADLYEVSPLYFGDVVDLRASNESIARSVIYCADFRKHPEVPDVCSGMPANLLQVGAIDTVDVRHPILVIGTAYDPATPIQHAEQMRDALGDAVVLNWDGVAHTAFVSNTFCIDDAVVEYLLDDVVPDDGTTCDFVPFAEGLEDTAEYLFELPPFYAESLIAEALDGRGERNADCLALELSGAGDRVATHAILGVESSDYVAAREAAVAACG